MTAEYTVSFTVDIIDKIKKYTHETAQGDITMLMTLVALDWKKGPADPELQQIMRHAALSLVTHGNGAKIYFEHELAKGVITRKEAGTVGVFSGPQFLAEYFRPDSSLEFELSFLVPRGSISVDTLLSDPGGLVTSIRTSPGSAAEIVGQFDPSTLSAPTIHRPN